MDINIIKNEDDKYVFEIKGVDINRGLTNAIRRISLSEIPTCAFNKYTIYKNTSNCNNTNIETMLSHFIIRQEIGVTDKITLNISHKNNERQMIYLSPDKDFEFYLNDEKIDLHNKYKESHIIPLKFNQEIRLIAETSINIGDTHAKYISTIPYIYEEINENHFKMGIESRGQLKSKTILLKSLDIIINKMEKLKEIINKQTDENIIEFTIENENSTLGCILKNYFYNNKNIEKVAYEYISNINVLKIFFQGENLKVNINKEINRVIEIINKLIQKFK